MELRKFKEKDKKKIGIIFFTISCILLICGVILYRTFAIFQVDTTQNMIEGNIQDEGDIRFMVYVDDVLQKDVPNKESGYSLDTSTSYCENGDLISWNDERWSVELKNISTTKTKCYLKFKQIYKEGILNGAIPDLGNGRLIPVMIENNGKVYKADITSEWYKYETQKWANAVILKDETKTYKNNELIPESNIESYFVWIPRYRYQIWNGEADSYTEIKENLGSITDSVKETKLNQQKEIKIIFEDKNKESPSNGTTLNSWLTHPAFTAFNSNGMWVGKFETGYNQNSDLKSEITNTTTWSNLEAQKNENNSEKIIIKPNVYSWRGIDISHAFYTSYNYQENLQSHMMKNMEWGAVAYLTISQYGRCKSGDCKEIKMNNNDQHITGYSANFIPTCGWTGTNEPCNKFEEEVGLNQDGENGYSYYNPSSQAASTTDNYYGIYDMAGGTAEYVMGVMQYDANHFEPTSGRSELINSGFIGKYSCPACDSQSATELLNGLPWPSSKYYDLYSYDTSYVTYQRGHLGDATKELGPFYSVLYISKVRNASSWYADIVAIPYNGSPWIRRGGGYSDGADAGIFLCDLAYGNVGADFTFRIVLMP